MINDGGIGGFYDFLYDNFAGQVVRMAVTDGRGRYMGDGEVYTIPADKSEFARAFGGIGGFRDIVFSGSDGMAGEGTRVVVYPGRKISNRRLRQQKWRAGELNCVLAPILKTLRAKHASYNEKMPGPAAKNYASRLKTLKEHAKRVSKCEEYMVKAMVEGVGEEYLTEICESLNVEVSIFAALQGLDAESMTIFTASSSKAATHRLKFNFINARINHVDVLPSKAEYNKLSYFPLDNGELLSGAAMKAKHAELKASSTAIYRYRIGHGDITAIATPTVLYKLDDPFMTVLGDFMTKTTLDAGQLCMLKDREVSNFIKRGVHGNGTVDKSVPCTYKQMLLYPDDYVRELAELKVARANSKSIDMKRAYTQGRKCDQYVGYPHKITDFRVTDKIEGVGYYFVKSFDWSIPYTKHERFYEIEKSFLNCFRGMDVYASPLLRFLELFEVGMEIVYGAWGTSIDFDFNEHPEMMEKYRGTMSDDGEILSSGQRGYALGVGIMQCLRPTNMWYLDVDDEDIPLFEHYQFQRDLNCPSMHFFGDGKLGATYARKQVSHSLHVAGFITAYVQLNMFKMLLNCGVPVNKMLRVCSDGAYFDVANVSDITYDDTLFAEKEVNIDPTGVSGSFSNGAADTYTGETHSDHSLDFYQRLEEGDPLLCTIARRHHQFNAVVGAGGCAKSAVTLRDVFVAGGCVQQHGEVGNGGLVRAMYFGPSHNLRADKQSEYPHVPTMCWQALFSLCPEVIRRFSRQNVWIVDECSMLLKTAQLGIMALAEELGVKVIFLGDPGYQAAPVPQLDKTTGECNKEEFDVSHFTEGVNLQTLTVNYRFKCDILASFALELRRLICEKASYLEGHRFVREHPLIRRVNLDEVRSTYALGDWILVRTHVIGEMYTALFPHLERYHVTVNSKNHFKGSIVFEVPDVKHIRTHASTMHAVQGITVRRPRKLFIDMSRPMELRVLYTALSRPETFDQIYLIVDERIKRPRYEEGPASCEVDTVDSDECFF